MNGPSMHPSCPACGDSGVRPELLERLRRCDYLAYERIVCRLLTAMGYDRAELLGRTKLCRNRNGGADIGAVVRTGVSIGRVIVQAKQYGVPVQAKYVDELRGAMARLGASHGIIVSTSEFSQVAVASAKASKILPVRLIGGDLLARLLVRYCIGVRSCLRAVLTVDDGLLDQLSR